MEPEAIFFAQARQQEGRRGDAGSTVHAQARVAPGAQGGPQRRLTLEEVRAIHIELDRAKAQLESNYYAALTTIAQLLEAWPDQDEACLGVAIDMASTLRQSSDLDEATSRKLLDGAVAIAEAAAADVGELLAHVYQGIATCCFYMLGPEHHPWAVVMARACLESGDDTGLGELVWDAFQQGVGEVVYNDISDMVTGGETLGEIGTIALGRMKAPRNLADGSNPLGRGWAHVMSGLEAAAEGKGAAAKRHASRAIAYEESAYLPDPFVVGAAHGIRAVVLAKSGPGSWEEADRLGATAEDSLDVTGLGRGARKCVKENRARQVREQLRRASEMQEAERRREEEARQHALEEAREVRKRDRRMLAWGLGTALLGGLVGLAVAGSLSLSDGATIDDGQRAAHVIVGATLGAIIGLVVSAVSSSIRASGKKEAGSMGRKVVGKVAIATCFAALAAAVTVGMLHGREVYDSGTSYDSILGVSDIEAQDGTVFGIAVQEPDEAEVQQAQQAMDEKPKESPMKKWEPIFIIIIVGALLGSGIQPVYVINRK